MVGNKNTRKLTMYGHSERVNEYNIVPLHGINCIALLIHRLEPVKSFIK